MARHGIDPGAFIHVADSALITHDNLKRAEQNGIHFISRLPATFNECARAIEQADARQAAEQLAAHGQGSYHRIRTEVVQRPKFGRGRPAKNTQRTPVGYGYRIQAEIVPDAEAIAPLKLGAGCFVLLSNVPISFQGRQWTASDLLSRYKEQYGIEKNFGFLKDPVIVNSIFLKKNERIEVLGMVLLNSLLIWRLMERTMRQHIEQNNQTITGWDNRQTTRPTSFMMTTTKFINTLVLTVGDQRKLARPLRAEQIEFLAALKVSSEVFTFP
jgi:transposase